MSASESVPETVAASDGNTEEDWKVFNVLIKETEMDLEDVDATTALRSDIAALQYKKDRLTEDLTEMKGQIRAKDQRCLELQMEADQLREQVVRQNAIIASLKKRVHELEERERNLYATQGRSEISIQSLQRECRYNEEKVRDLEKKLRNIELELNGEEQKKEAARIAYQDLVRRLGMALGFDISDSSLLSGEALVLKGAELLQETSRLRNRSSTINDTLTSVEMELRSCRESLERTLSDKESLQRQSANQLLELDKLRQEKESLEMQQRVTERENLELREKLSACTRNLGSASGNVAQLESTVCQLREELKMQEEKNQRLYNEHRTALESFALLLNTSSRFVESTEEAIRERIRDLIADNREKSSVNSLSNPEQQSYMEPDTAFSKQVEALREKLVHESQQYTRQLSMYEQANTRLRSLEEGKSHVEHKLHKMDAELNALELSREGLKRDKSTFMSFLERLARALNMDEISSEVGVELHTESLLLRAEQLARLESDKLVDKTATVYQLQRKLRTLREQLQRKELHLDLLRRKLTIQEDTTKTKFLLQGERDEAHTRVKKLTKQVDRLQMQLVEAKDQIRDLNTQLAEAAEYKITALERGRRIEELQKQLLESEALRTKYNRKVALLKEQMRSTGQTIDQERSISDHSMQLLRDELARVKESFAEVTRREAQLQSFKSSVAKILGVALPLPDYELVSRLQKLVDAHHDFTVVSRRYDDPVLRLTSRSPTVASRYTRTPERTRYDDSGYADAADIDDTDDDLFKRPST